MKKAVQFLAGVAVLVGVNAAQAACVTTGTLYYQRTVCSNTQTNVIGSGSNLGSVDPILSQPKPSYSSSIFNSGYYNLSSLYQWK